MPNSTTMKRAKPALAMALLCLLTLARATSLAQELWKMNPTGENGIESFNRAGTGIWVSQQGLIFISSDRLVIYQVNRNAKHTGLAQRDASGGSGNFLLLARVLDARTGREISRMQFQTASDYSSILPTQKGKFIVRTGSLLSLFSPDFKPLLSRELPLTKAAPLDYWEVGVTPSGRQVALVHQEVFENPESEQDSTETAESKNATAVEMLDADTLRTIRTVNLPYYLPVWSVQERFLLTTTPHKPATDSRFGAVDFEGHWNPLRPIWENREHNCSYKIALLDHDLMAAYGCAGLTVFSQSGGKLFALPPHSWQRFTSVAASDHYLAVEKDEYVEPVDRPPSWQPSGIQVYDLQSGKSIVSAKVKKRAIRYALSAEGLLAVLDGDVLKLYRPD
jgi:hypothetical protein